MSVNQGLAHVSTDFMIAALLIYSLALLAFAGDYAFGRPRRREAMLAAKPAVDRAAQLATVGAASESNAAPGPGSSPAAPGQVAAAAGPGDPAGRDAARPVRRQARSGRSRRRGRGSAPPRR